MISVVGPYPSAKGFGHHLDKVMRSKINYDLGTFVTTLALGLQPRQGLARVHAKKEA